LISLAPSCEPFAPGVSEKTLEFVDCLAPLENPIQISTKRFVNSETARRISHSQVNSGQIVIYVTITSFSHWAVIEPGSVDPQRRLEGLANAQDLGINSCLYIKPVLPGITEREVDSFSEAIKRYKIPYCVVGVLYVSDSILTRLKKRGLYTKELQEQLSSRGTIPPPAHPNDPSGVSNLSSLSTVRGMLKRLQTTGSECLINGPCVMALSYDILSPTGIWLYRPHMCVECSAECRSEFSKLPPGMQAAYPTKNPLPK
jgi:hypothetical protein